MIENKDFENLIQVYDRENALFYLDPPYVGTEGYYQIPFTEQDHLRLSDVLRGIRGKFILSYNNVPLIHNLYERYQIREVDRNNTLSGNGNNKEKFKELIITNF